MKKKVQEDLSLIPRSIDELGRMSKMMAMSQLAPSSVRGKPQDVAVIIMTGMELGIPPMTALRTIHVVEGKAVLSADLQVACAHEHPQCRYVRCIESDGKRAVYETQRGEDKPVQASFTIEEAKLAGLLSKSNWRKYPAAMLRARAKSILVRDVYPDALAGVYTPDEAEEIARSHDEPTEVIDVIDVEVADAVPAVNYAGMSSDELFALVTDPETADSVLTDERFKTAVRMLDNSDARRQIISAWQHRQKESA